MPNLFRVLLGTVLLVLLILSVTPVMAQHKPVQLSLFNPIQIFPETDGITGVRLNLLYGRNTKVIGVDFGLVNHTTSG
ncbi:MAG: hypothetical protein GY865_02350, partial [candidate division Zixibacteria bacterium]|nr:hypothetical protein [candidate division Zixibacteria bacterium]